MKQNKFPFSAAFRGAIGFGLGGLLVVLPTLQPLVPSVGQGTVIRLLRLLVPIALSFAGGVVGGASLRAGKKTTIGFGLGFVFPAFLAQISFVAPQAWEGEESSQEILLFYVSYFSIGFVLAGGIGSVFTRLGLRVIILCVVGFGLCGVIGGIIAAVPELPTSTSLPNKKVLIASSVVVPFILAGAIAGGGITWARRLQSPEERDAGHV